MSSRVSHAFGVNARRQPSDVLAAEVVSAATKTHMFKPAAPFDPSSQTPIQRASEEGFVPTDMPTDNLSPLATETRPVIDWPLLPQAPPERPSFPRYMFIASAATGRPASAKAEAARREKIQQAVAKLDGRIERLASPFGDGMIYTICELPSNRAAASFATVMRAAYDTGVRTVALPRPRRQLYQGA